LENQATRTLTNPSGYLSDPVVPPRPYSFYLIHSFRVSCWGFSFNPWYCKKVLFQTPFPPHPGIANQTTKRCLVYRTEIANVQAKLIQPTQRECAFLDGIFRNGRSLSQGKQKELDTFAWVHEINHVKK
jgi:hypothetical protein